MIDHSRVMYDDNIYIYRVSGKICNNDEVVSFVESVSCIFSLTSALFAAFSIFNVINTLTTMH